ncbi:MAG TPA: hypothetical protein VE843_02895 [Ktedonobacteraceae bacterium]|nr:hypothetical protein [Ktedonobacteraceae bacterium]
MEPQKDLRGQTELPTWLESLRVNERSNSPVSDQSQFSMSELIDEGALPTWMRQENAEMIEKGNSGKYPAWRPASMSAPHTDEGNIPPEGLPARSLIDEQSLPSWVHSTTGSMPAAPDSQKNFSAASLIQPDDLPDWMKSMPQSPQPFVPQSNVWGDAQPPASQVRENVYTPDPAYHNSQLPPQSFPNESSGLNASSLLDTNSLPPWLREGEQIQSYGSSQPGPAPTGNSGLAGSSLIDANAVPEWLRTFDNQQQTHMQSMGNARPYGTAPRIENVPVPSRPRAEIVPQEQSEVAANVFSSFLGVASSAPHFPSPETGSQWQVPGQGTMPPPQGFQNVQPQPPAGMQWNASAPPPGVTGGPQGQGYNPAVYQGGQQVVNPVGGNANYPGMPQQQVSGPRMPMGSPMAQQSSATESRAKPAKRGFLDTIRSWFK